MNLKQILKQAELGKVAHLATASSNLQPHLVPVVFVILKRNIFIPLDCKPKSTAVKQLKRVKNIEANPKVAFLVDNYEDDWERLWFVMLVGSARLIDHSISTARDRGFSNIQKLLFKKYSQYSKIGMGRIYIKIKVLRGVYWRYSK